MCESFSQLDLFSATARAYVDRELADNAEVYAAVADALAVDPDAYVAPVGSEGRRYNLFHRSVRWVQQSLKEDGLLERVPEERGLWRLTGKGRIRLREWQAPGAGLVAFSTRLGVAILGDCRAVFRQVDAPIALCITSPPYPLASPRAYGNQRGDEYIDFICDALEPIVSSLKTGGSIVLNISNDIFETGSPARSLYREKLVLALAERLGLFKMDEIPWVNRSKPPGPTAWACKERQQLAVAWEPLYWFTNDAVRCESDNRRVLRSHTERHARLIAGGGDRLARASGDKAHSIRPGRSFASDCSPPCRTRLPTSQAVASSTLVLRRPQWAETDSPSAFKWIKPWCLMFSAALMSRSCCVWQAGHFHDRTFNGMASIL